jgi:hypothetical protein
VTGLTDSPFVLLVSVTLLEIKICDSRIGPPAPPPVADSVPADKLRPEPTVTLLKPPVPLLAKSSVFAPVGAGAAPIVLYESVTAVEPLNVVPDAAPEPELLRVKALVVVPLPPVALNVPAENDSPVPIVTLEKPPDPLTYH